MQFESEDFRDEAEFNRMSSLVRGLTDGDLALDEPPAEIWASLSARVDADRVAAGPSSATPHVQSGSTISATGAPAEVVELGSRRPRTQMFLAAAAVVALLAGLGAYLASNRPNDKEQVLASVELKQLRPLGDVAAHADLIKTGNTTRLVIFAKNMPPAPAGSKYELWLMDKKIVDAKSLGAVSGSESVVVPSSIDPKKFPVVDISLEPAGTNGTYSGHSLMRGEFT